MEHHEGLKLLNSLTFDHGNEHYYRKHDHFEQMAECEAEYHLNRFFYMVIYGETGLMMAHIGINTLTGKRSYSKNPTLVIDLFLTHKW